MSSSEYRVRRATVDDKEQLTAVWNSMRLPADDLFKRITEFQVAEGSDGKIAGALGIQMAERQGLVHGECYPDFALTDRLRPLLWERIQSLATNHGLLRLWTQETAPFWKQNGFQRPDADALQKLPEAWDRTAPGWLTFGLRTEEAIAVLEKEMAIYMAAEKQRTARTLERARTMKVVVTVFAIMVAVGTFAAAFWLWILHRRGTGLGH